MKKLKEHKWILLILLLSFIVRFVGVPKYPIGFTQDEAGVGYDAYSILKTGRDTWGEVFPLTLRSFGDFKLPLYSYLAIPFIAVFGLNEFAVRLPGVILGTFAILVSYLMVQKLSGDKKLSLWSALLLGFSPWHVPLSRGAFEANLTTFFIPLGIYLFYKGLEEKKWMALSVVVFGLNLFSYHSARLVTPLIIAGLVFLNKSIFHGKTITEKIPKGINKYKVSFVLFFFFFATVVYTMLSGSNSRALDITIFNPTDGWLAMSEKRFYIIYSGLDMHIARLFVNKFGFIFQEFVRNYFKYLSPQFLFTEGVSDWNYGMIPGRGALYLFELITLTASLIAVVKKQSFKHVRLIIFWILISPIPAALTKGGGASGTRAAVMMPAIQILSAFGLIYFLKNFKNSVSRVINPVILEVVAIIILVISFSNFLISYIYYYPTQASDAMQTSRKEMAVYLNEVGGSYEKIRVSRSLGVPHVWIMFYHKTDPSLVQEYSKNWLAYDDGEKVSIDQYDGYELGNYIFGNIFYEDRHDDVSTLFVGRPEDFHSEVDPLKIIENSIKNPAIYIVDK